jgi:hypothetical protein
MDFRFALRRVRAFGITALLAVTVAGCPELFAPDDESESDDDAPSTRLSCPGTLPDPFICVTNNGVSAPATWDLPDEVYGLWIDTSFGVCMYIGVPPSTSNRQTAFRYRGGFGGGTTTEQRPFGALVSSSGQLTPNSTTFYLLTGSSDSQIKLMLFDRGTSRFVGQSFTKAPNLNCAW